jgi:hypothetical protein
VCAQDTIARPFDGDALTLRWARRSVKGPAVAPSPSSSRVAWKGAAAVDSISCGVGERKEISELV